MEFGTTIKISALGGLLVTLIWGPVIGLMAGAASICVLTGAWLAASLIRG